MTQLAKNNQGNAYLDAEQARNLQSGRVYNVKLDSKDNCRARFVKKQFEWWWTDEDGFMLNGTVTHVDFGS